MVTEGSLWGMRVKQPNDPRAILEAVKVLQMMAEDHGVVLGEITFSKPTGNWALAETYART